MTKQEEIINTIKVLRNEVEVLTTRLKPNATGHLHTAIGVINSRIDELIGSAIDAQPDKIRGLAGKIFDEDVYGNLEGQARLRRIQDSAAGKPNRVRDAYLYSSRQGTLPKQPDDYEHTEEYYDTERNKSQSMTQPHKNVYDNAADIQNMSSDGLSNRSIKQKYGQAVQTVSEMMQEELEPLPINTFE